MPLSDLLTTDPVSRALAALEQLDRVIDAESAALSKGQLREGLSAGDDKAAAFAAYLAALNDMRAVPPERLRLIPGVERLRQRHAAFEKALSVNLAILSTTRTVSEGLLREVSSRIATGAGSAYGPPGAARSSPPASAPISLSRTS